MIIYNQLKIANILFLYFCHNFNKRNPLEMVYY